MPNNNNSKHCTLSSEFSENVYKRKFVFIFRDIAD